jgi:hypothetical protein
VEGGEAIPPIAWSQSRREWPVCDDQGVLGSHGSHAWRRVWAHSAQIEIDKRVAVLEDFLERSGRRNARAASHTTPKTKTKRAAAKPPAGGYDYCYDDEDNPLHWLSSAEDALLTPIVPCMSQLSAVPSGRPSGSVSSGSTSSGFMTSGSTSSGSVSSGFTSSGFMSFPAGPTSVALTAENVQRQIDNSTPSWLGEFKSMTLSAMNERTAASNTAMHKFVASALQDDMKALHSQAAASENRLESWTEKLAHGLDLQGKRTFELGCDVKKMGDRMAAMERAAGIAPPCQSAHVT